MGQPQHRTCHRLQTPTTTKRHRRALPSSESCLADRCTHAVVLLARGWGGADRAWQWQQKRTNWTASLLQRPATLMANTTRRHRGARKSSGQVRCHEIQCAVLEQASACMVVSANVSPNSSTPRATRTMPASVSMVVCRAQHSTTYPANFQRTIKPANFGMHQIRRQLPCLCTCLSTTTDLATKQNLRHFAEHCVIGLRVPTSGGM